MSRPESGASGYLAGDRVPYSGPSTRAPSTADEGDDRSARSPVI